MKAINYKQKKSSVYLPYSSEVGKNGDHVFKYGKTKKPFQRFRNYPKESHLVYFSRVKESGYVEDKMEHLFQENYKQSLRYGYEYFEVDDVKKMIKQIDDIINSIDQKVDDDILDELKECYKNHLIIDLQNDKIDDISDDFIDTLIA